MLGETRGYCCLGGRGAGVGQAGGGLITEDPELLAGRAGCCRSGNGMGLAAGLMVGRLIAPSGMFRTGEGAELNEDTGGSPGNPKTSALRGRP